MNDIIHFDLAQSNLDDEQGDSPECKGIHIERVPEDRI